MGGCVARDSLYSINICPFFSSETVASFSSTQQLPFAHTKECSHVPSTHWVHTAE